MNEGNQIEKLGKPDIRLDCLKIWIHGRQFPELTEYWDGNWLRVTVHCGSQGASVWANGPIIHLSEIQSWLTSLEQMNQTLKGKADLECMQPELSIDMTILDQLGHLKIAIHLTPDHMTQEHKF